MKNTWKQLKPEHQLKIRTAAKKYSYKPEQKTLAKVETKVIESRKIPEMTILGLVHNCYIIAENMCETAWLHYSLHGTKY